MNFQLDEEDLTVKERQEVRKAIVRLRRRIREGSGAYVALNKTPRATLAAGEDSFFLLEQDQSGRLIGQSMHADDLRLLCVDQVQITFELVIRGDKPSNHLKGQHTPRIILLGVCCIGP